MNLCEQNERMKKVEETILKNKFINLYEEIKERTNQMIIDQYKFEIYSGVLLNQNK